MDQITHTSVAILAYSLYLLFYLHSAIRDSYNFTIIRLKKPNNKVSHRFVQGARFFSET